MSATRHTSPDTAHSTRFIVASWAAVVVMAGVIFWMSANTGDAINSGLGIVSAVKAALAGLFEALAGTAVDVSPIGHFVEYLLFGATLINALRLHLTPQRALALAVVVASVYGVTDELHQSFVPMRSCDPADWLVDTAAAAVGALVVYAVLKRQGATQRNR